MSRWLRLAFLTLPLAACSTGSVYQRPDLPVPVSFPAAAGATPATEPLSAAAVGTDWQRYFTDPTLRELIAVALKHNRDLRIAVGRVAEARALSGLSTADRFPSVDLGAQRAASRTPGDLSATTQAVNSQRYDVNLSVTSFELDFWGRVKSLNDAARANFLASDYARRAFELSLIAEVAQAYFALQESAERLVLTQAVTASREETRMLVGRRRDVGLANDLDYLQADGAFQAARAELASTARARAVATNALRLLVGNDVPDRLRSSNPLEPMKSIEHAMTESMVAIQVALPAEQLLIRPDVLASEQRLIAAHASLNAARAAFFPKITLTAAAGTASKTLAGLFDAGSRAWSFIPMIRLPLFDASRTEDNADLTAARRHIAVADYEKTIQQAFREVADLLSAREQLTEQLRAQEANALAQSQRLKIADARYRAGVSSHLELLDAQRESLIAQAAALAVRRQVLATSASLFKALGGGPEA